METDLYDLTVNYILENQEKCTDTMCAMVQRKKLVKKRR